MATKSDIEMDLYSNWVSNIKLQLKAWGYSLTVGKTDREIAIIYFNLLRRRISSKRRNIYVSKEFSCPPQYDVALELIKAKIKNGEDLVPHQSTRLSELIYHDDLLNDWDIHHLHLGTNLQTNNFVERTGPVLFARVTADSFYFIDVKVHGNGHQPWFQTKLLEIIHHNWPETIARYRIVEASEVEFTPTEGETKQLRNGHVNVIYKMNDGTIYAPVGGGITTSGGSIIASMKELEYNDFFRRIEKYIKDNIETIRLTAKNEGKILGNILNFELKELLDGSIYISEVKSGFVFKIDLTNG